ncbi:MAG: glycosyl transferase family protein [Candidatus Peribacteria bacterium]|nr:glycosyl transferase family protein [Candidatus Peribacteria bacterium]
MSAQVSILVPTYEPDPAHLRQALDSILEQTFSNWTVLIQDDESASDVESMIQAYCKDPRFSFRRNAHRLGIGGNWNSCVHGTGGLYKRRTM